MYKCNEYMRVELDNFLCTYLFHNVQILYICIHFIYMDWIYITVYNMYIQYVIWMLLDGKALLFKESKI